LKVFHGVRLSWRNDEAESKEARSGGV